MMGKGLSQKLFAASYLGASFPTAFPVSAIRTLAPFSLEQMEQLPLKGHTVGEHVAKSRKEMTDRAIRDKKSVISTYTSLEVAKINLSLMMEKEASFIAARKMKGNNRIPVEYVAPNLIGSGVKLQDGEFVPFTSSTSRTIFEKLSDRQIYELPEDLRREYDVGKIAALQSEVLEAIPGSPIDLLLQEDMKFLVEKVLKEPAELWPEVTLDGTLRLLEAGNPGGIEALDKDKLWRDINLISQTNLYYILTSYPVWEKPADV